MIGGDQFFEIAKGLQPIRAQADSAGRLGQALNASHSGQVLDANADELLGQVPCRAISCGP